MVEKLLLVFQQSELDAVKMYQVLTDKAGSEDEKQLLRRHSLANRTRHYLSYGTCAPA